MEEEIVFSPLAGWEPLLASLPPPADSYDQRMIDVDLRRVATRCIVAPRSDGCSRRDGLSRTALRTSSKPWPPWHTTVYAWPTCMVPLRWTSPATSP